MPYPPHYQGEGSRTPVHDRLGSCQSGQQQQVALVRPVQPDRSDRSQQRPAHSHPPRQEYRVKKREEDVQPMQVDSGKTTTDDVVKIGDVNVVVKDVGKKPMVFGKSAQTDFQKHVLANDHEASSSSSVSKYHQPRWCPSGLSHSEKRKLQCLRRQEQKEQEAEKLRDEHFNKYRPMVPQGKEWRAKPIMQSAGPVEPPQVIGLTGADDRSDCQAQPVRPVEPVDQQKA